MSNEQLQVLLKDTLLIIKGTSKKNSRDYAMVVVKNDVRFNNFAIDCLTQQGVEVLDIRNKVTA